jgi:glycosyltransferase involved in cell wall biosynthesis
VATATGSADGGRPAPLPVTIITRGSPDQLSGGYLYHRRLAEAAPEHGAAVGFVSASPWRDPLARISGVAVVDSITAWSVAPWTFVHRSPLAAVLHQPPGGVDRSTWRSRRQRSLDLVCYRRCQLLVAASTALGDSLVADHGFDPAAIRVIEPGCDLAPAAEPPPDPRAGRRVAALCVANWLPAKGVLELLEAVAGLADDRVTLHLAGRQDVDPGYGERLSVRLAAPDLRDRVVAHGPLSREAVAALYAAADVFVLPSYVETYGTVYGEALKAGLPTVGWRAGNLTNLVTDGVEGCLLHPGDVGALRSALDRLAVDDAWRAELAAAAHRRGDRLPTWADAASAFFAAVRALPTAPG